MRRRSPGEEATAEGRGVGDGRRGDEGEDDERAEASDERSTLAAASGDGGGLAAASGDGAAMAVTLPGSDERQGGDEAAIAPGAELGRYHVLRRVGEGGMGVVYEAKDRELARTVAIKVLRRAGRAGNGARRARLVREAQTMAKLAHPNLVPVFDVGELAGDLFVAMELVDGEDLARWIARPNGRPWREVVQVFLQAAKGLDAAHRAGVIHRDFKPSNVMVGRDGRARVFDFGLARADSDPDSDPDPDEPRPLRDAAGPLTELGAVLGTPAYLAPAQLRGELADAASDQYAFAVSLREALTGALPFSAHDLTAQLSGGPALAPPLWPAGKLPRSLRKLVDRAMAPSASARFPSMAEVIDALERTLSAARRRNIAIAAALSIVAVAGIASGVARTTASASAPSPPACDGAASLLIGAWDGDLAAQVSRRFASVGTPSAAKAATSVRAVLDDYAARWRDRRREICRATFERGEQTERVMQLRFACLDRRRGELAALTSLLASADRTAVDRSLAAVGELPSLAACDDVAALDSPAPLPRDPEVRRQIDEVQAEVDKALAQRRAGQYQEGLALAASILPRAEQLAYPPLLAGALFAYAELENWGGDAVHAEELYRRAARLYAELGDDAGLANAWVTLVFVVGSLEGKPGDGAKLGEFASTLVARRRDAVLEAQLDNHLGAVAYGAGKLDDAAAHFERALKLRRQVLGPEHLGVANTLANFGAVRRSQERYDEAEALGREALALKQKLLGEDHPEVAVSLRNLAALAISRKQLPLARSLEEQAMQIHRRASGDDHFEVANSLTNLGQTYMEEQDYAQAVSYQERALATYRKSLPAGHPLIGKAAFSLADSLAELKRYRESLALAEEALGILDVPDGNPVDRAHAAYQVALALGALKVELPRARVLMAEARDAYREIGAETWQGMAEGWIAAHGGRGKP